MRTPMLLSVLLALTLSGCLADGGADGLDADLPGDPEPAARPARLLHEERFEGTAPAAEPGVGALQMLLPVQVPEGADRVLVTYNTTYTGLWPSYVYLFDAAGKERASSGEDCGLPALGPHVLESYTCAIELGHDIQPGRWTFQMTWQVGEVAEQYVVDVAVWGTG